ncbi:MAG: type VI secretion system protein TssL, partial [Porticoccaceae bacterium]|nr:type VI secretion system protein TssL [Porticoccaceae bacterium]
MSDEDEQDSAPRIPGWMASFADLMTLLLCFFVLLLSFSEMDVIKYKQVAGSMRHAFGVQSEIPASGIPLGTSIIAQEFSSGRPDPTVENVVQQQTVDNLQMTLEVRQSEEGEALGSFDADEEAARELLISKLISMRADTEADAQALAEVLGKEIADDMIDIESEFRSITIRIRERGSFGSGSSSLNEDFIDVLEKLRNVLSDVEGQLSVQGHIDDVPISTE